ncbi:MAG: 2TM domain-containing protein [Actinobacteria bacterium]|nr:2TM domain-containing protein [Actinomycetota bacterium]
MNDEELRKQARKRLEGQQAFKVMIGIFAISAVIILVTWWLVGGGYFWPGWALLGMAATALIFGWVVYGPTTAVPDSKVDQEIDRMRGK